MGIGDVVLGIGFRRRQGSVAGFAGNRRRRRSLGHGGERDQREVIVGLHVEDHGLALDFEREIKVTEGIVEREREMGEKLRKKGKGTMGRTKGSKP